MWKRLGLATLAAAMALSGGIARGAGQEKVQTASGIVVAVEEGSKTILVESTLAGEQWLIGAEVTEHTRFEGRAKGLQDLTPGSKVTLQWVREENRLVVRSVRLR